MSKLHLLIVLLYTSLCAMGVYAQQNYVLSLEQMFALADENNKTIHTEYAIVQEAEQDVQVAKNGRLPDIDISLSASYLGNGYLLDRNFSNGTSIDIPHFGNNFSITATQLIYGGGKINNSIAIAKLKQEMANISLEATRSRVRFMLTGFYLDLYKLQNALQVYDKSIELSQMVIKDTKARNAAGIALQNDITRQELQLKNIELARKHVANSIEIVNYNLVSLLGLPSDTQIKTDSTLLEQVLPTQSLDYWQEKAQKEAHTTKQSEIAVKLGEYGEKMERANMIPSIAFIAGSHFDGPITIEIPTINKNFNYWYAGVGISFPIHSLYKAGKSIKKARYATEQSRRRQADVIQQTNLDIKEDYTRLLEAYDAVTTLEKSVELAHENYNIIENRYRNDIALVTDMLDAANQRLDAELQLVNARINVIFNYYKLMNTSGNL